MVVLDEGGAGAGALVLVAPPPALAATIEHLWVQAGPHRRRRWRVVPDTSAHVIVSMAVAPRGAAVTARVAGARTTYADLEVGERRWTVGARLRPGALPLLLRAHATALTDRSLRLDAVAAPRALAALGSCAAPREALRALLALLSTALAGRAGDDLGLARAASVDAAAGALGLSPRALHARALARWGLPPKLALRIARLHAALHALAGGASLAGVAAHAGYSDQAHFTREAGALLGETPAAWRRRGASDPFKTGAPSAP
jgi:AraC-like DNA-binding protein